MAGNCACKLMASGKVPETLGVPPGQVKKLIESSGYSRTTSSAAANTTGRLPSESSRPNSGGGSRSREDGAARPSV